MVATGSNGLFTGALTYWPNKGTEPTAQKRAAAHTQSLCVPLQFMNIETRQLLTRWQSLEKNDGLRRAVATSRRLWMVGLVLCIFVVFAMFYGLHPVFIAGPAAAMGWVIAESNALRTRLAQWPIVKAYIDWKKVEEDLKG